MKKKVICSYGDNSDNNLCNYISCQHHNIHEENQYCYKYCHIICKEISCENSLDILRRKRKLKLEKLDESNL